MSEGLVIYLVSGHARRDVPGTCNVEVIADIVHARSEAEAIGIASQYVRDKFPGYSSNFGAREVTDRARELLSLIDETKP